MARLMDTARRIRELELAAAAEEALERAVDLCEDGEDEDFRAAPQPAWRGGKAASVGDFEAALKTMYTPQRVMNAVFKASPWLEMLRRMEFRGERVRLPIAVPRLGHCSCLGGEPPARPSVPAWELTMPSGLGCAAGVPAHVMRSPRETAGAVMRAGDAAVERLAGAAAKKLAGELDEWLPAEVVDPDAWCGIDRTVDPARLAGGRITEGSGGIREAIEAMLCRLGREGGKPDMCLLPPEAWLRLQASMRMEADCMIMGPTGPCRVFCEGRLPKDAGYIMQSGDWMLWLLPPRCAVRRSEIADDYELQFSMAARLACSYPGRSGRMLLKEE